jgi:Thioester domain/PEP-CTERM motif
MLLKKILLIGILFSLPAVANTIIVVGTDNALGENVWINENGTSTQVYAGGIDIKVDGYSRLAFCIELFVNISIATYNTTLDFSDTSSGIQRVAWLLVNQYPTTAAAGAGFQLAIWDILTDGGDGFSAGKVQKSTGTATNATVLADAMGYETASSGKSSTTKFVVYENTTTQGVKVQTLMGLWPTDGGPFPETPEPASIFMILSGLALIGLSRIRRVR